MTDQETFVEMIKRVGIEFKQEPGLEGSTCISIERGYAGFVVEVFFSEDGRFEDIQAME